MTHKYSIRQNLLVLLWNRSLIWNSWGQKSQKCCFICICVTFHQVVVEKIIFQMAAILNCLIWRHHWELALAPGRFGQSISKITSVPIFMLLYKFAHSLMRIPLIALTKGNRWHQTPPRFGAVPWLVVWVYAAMWNQCWTRWVTLSYILLLSPML